MKYLKYSPKGPSLTPDYNRMLNMWNAGKAKKGLPVQAPVCDHCEKDFTGIEAYPQDEDFIEWFCSECNGGNKAPDFSDYSEYDPKELDIFDRFYA